jgi:hypothetical protein
MARKSYRRREKKSSREAPKSAAEVSAAPDGQPASDGESPTRLMAWLWGLPIALVTLAVVLKVTGVS